jgi:hypothetical protein
LQIQRQLVQFECQRIPIGLFNQKQILRLQAIELVYDNSLLNPGLLSLYPYCLSNSVNISDPLGLQGSQWNLISSYEALFNNWKMPQDTKLRLRTGSSGTIFFNNFSWDTSNPAERKRSYEYLSYVGGAWHFILTTEAADPHVIVNLGIGKFFGMSFGEEYISLNLGFGLATPITITTPCEDQ